MYGEMGAKSNTIMFNDRPADVNALLSQAVVAMKAVAGDQPTTTKALEAGSTASTATSPSEDGSESKEKN
jgi:hypothetical protein